MNDESGYKTLDKPYKKCYFCTYREIVIMEAKLTLKLDQAVIDSAKTYAGNSQKSLSKLVEDFFRSLTGDDNMQKKYPPLIEKLSGFISEEDLEKVSRNDEKVRHILKKNR
jgi:uncharacterized membrane-anchored protein YjiN (DUF445 family)